MRITNIRLERSTLFHVSSRTLCLLAGGSTLLRSRRFDLLIAPQGIHKFAIDAEAQVIARQIVPEETGGGIVHVGNVVVERKLVSVLSLKIVGAFFAAVRDLPRLLVIIGGDRCRRPDMSIAGNFSTVVEIVEYAELQCELVLVGRDVCTVHCERRIAVADFQVTENLIVGAILLHDVNDMLDRILPAGEGNRAGIAVEQIVALDHLGVLGQLGQGRGDVQPRNRSSEQSGYVGMLFVLALVDRLAHVFVGTGAFALGAGDEKIASMDSKSRGIPVGRDEAQERLASGKILPEINLLRSI